MRSTQAPKPSNVGKVVVNIPNAREAAPPGCVMEQAFVEPDERAALRERGWPQWRTTQWQ